MSLLHPGILDAAFQLMVLAHSNFYETDSCLLPFSIDDCIISSGFRPEGECWATLHVKSHSEDSLTGSVEISKDGLLLARLSGATIRSKKEAEAKPRQVLCNPFEMQVTYDLSWDPCSLYNGKGEVMKSKALLCCSEAKCESFQRSLSLDPESCHFTTDFSVIGEKLRCLEAP